ncbi:MAG: ABC transporter substrate-binding protein [Alphaproteobacteria bacterium]
MTRIVLLETLRALFYAPYYLAFARGLFAAHGVQVDVVRSPDADETARRLAAGEADLGWGGPLRVLSVLDEAPDAGLVCFAEVVGRDPFFVVGRRDARGFTLDDLQHMRIAVVSEVPTPWICLRQDLRDRGIDPAGLDVVTGRTMAENEAALASGEIDAFQAFQPFAERAVAAGAEVLYAAASRGPTAYTTFYGLRSRIMADRRAFEAMAAAMGEAVAEVYRAPGIDTARAIAGYFPDLPPALAGAAIDRYRALRLYSPGGAVSRAGFDRLRTSMIASGYIARGVDYDRCVVDLGAPA